MISVITCTASIPLPKELILNIQNTIGVSYELISIDNRNNQYSIFEAYNIGVSKAKHEICCFMHDDIIYHTANWGTTVQDLFDSDPKLGAIAVAGCKYICKTPSTWPIYHYNVINIIQSDKRGKHKSKNWFENSKLDDIIVFDGLWFCIRKTTFKIIKFDENFGGFHFYDLDIALQIHQLKLKIKAVPSILIEHTSWGQVNKDWLTNAFLFHEKWKSKLPISLIAVEKYDRMELEESAINYLLKVIIDTKKILLMKKWVKLSYSVYGNFWTFMRATTKYLISKIKKHIKSLKSFNLFFKTQNIENQYTYRQQLYSMGRLRPIFNHVGTDF